MSARDELAKVIYTSHRGNTQVDLLDNRRLQGSQLAWARLAADTLIASGWSKPRTITTAEELDALPIGSVILDNYLDTCRKNRYGRWESFDEPDATFDGPGMKGSLPAVVLHEPEVEL